jgi:hypothetical protein
MVGWINFILLSLSDSLIVIRLSSVLTTLIIALTIVDILKRLNKENQDSPWLIGAIFLALPMNLLFDIVTTDIPVAFFMFLAGYAYLRSELSESKEEAVLFILFSGVFIGLGILSKYFIFLPFLTILFLLLMKKKYSYVLIFILGISPFLVFHVYSNYQNCWTNFLFNFWHRHERSNFSLEWPFLYILSCLYIFTPWIVWIIFKDLKYHFTSHKNLYLLFLIPIGIFGLISLFL